MTKTAAAILAVLALAGCSGYNDARGRGDAPARQLPKQPVDVYPMPDRFGNVATLCDGHGHRLFVVTHSKTDAPVTVIEDPSCSGGPR
jgi:hypothetical protein